MIYLSRTMKKAGNWPEKRDRLEEQDLERQAATGDRKKDGTPEGEETCPGKKVKQPWDRNENCNLPRRPLS